MSSPRRKFNHGNPCLTDANRTPRATLDLTGGQPRLRLQDKNNGVRFIFYVREDGPGLTLRNKDNDSVIFMEGHGGEPQMFMHKNNRSLWHAP